MYHVWWDVLYAKKHEKWNQCWASVTDGGPTVARHWLNVSCLLAVHVGRIMFKEMDIAIIRGKHNHFSHFLLLKVDNNLYTSQCVWPVWTSRLNCIAKLVKMRFSEKKQKRFDRLPSKHEKLIYCCFNVSPRPRSMFVYDAGPTLKWQWPNVSCLLDRRKKWGALR